MLTPARRPGCLAQRRAAGGAVGLQARACPGQGDEAIRPGRSTTGLCGADYEIVKVAAHLKPTRLFDPAGLHRLEAGRADQPLDFLASMVIIGRVEEDRRLR